MAGLGEDGVGDPTAEDLTTEEYPLEGDQKLIVTRDSGGWVISATFVSEGGGEYIFDVGDGDPDKFFSQFGIESGLTEGVLTHEKLPENTEIHWKGKQPQIDSVQVNEPLEKYIVKFKTGEALTIFHGDIIHWGGSYYQLQKGKRGIPGSTTFSHGGNLIMAQTTEVEPEFQITRITIDGKVIELDELNNSPF